MLGQLRRAACLFSALVSELDLEPRPALLNQQCHMDCHQDKTGQDAEAKTVFGVITSNCQCSDLLFRVRIHVDETDQRIHVAIGECRL